MPVKMNISSAGLVDSGPVGGEAVQELYNSFYMRRFFWRHGQSLPLDCVQDEL